MFKCGHAGMEKQVVDSPTEEMQKMVLRIASDLDGLTARLMEEGRSQDARLVVSATETIEALSGALRESWGSLIQATEKVGGLQGRVRSVSERLGALTERLDALTERLEWAKGYYGAKE